MTARSLKSWRQSHRLPNPLRLLPDICRTASHAHPGSRAVHKMALLAFDPAQRVPSCMLDALASGAQRSISRLKNAVNSSGVNGSV